MVVFPPCCPRDGCFLRVIHNPPATAPAPRASDPLDGGFTHHPEGLSVPFTGDHGPAMQSGGVGILARSASVAIPATLPAPRARAPPVRNKFLLFILIFLIRNIKNYHLALRDFLDFLALRDFLDFLDLRDFLAFLDLRDFLALRFVSRSLHANFPPHLLKYS